MSDFAAYLDTHPEAYQTLLKQTHIRSVNHAAVELLEAADADELRAALHSEKVRPTNKSLRAKLELLWNGQSTAEVETRYRSLKGR